MSKNKSIDKMAEQFTSIEELQAYSSAQYNTITSLNSKINDLTKQIEILNNKNANLNKDLAIASVGSPKETNKFTVTDEEATCTIQLAMIKRNAMDRELTTDETKRLEVFVKTLYLIKGKDGDKDKKHEEKEVAKMSSEELLKYMDETLKDPQ